jgi:hypothetical protein
VKLYRVYAEDDWQVLVVHRLARLAKYAAWMAWPVAEAEWTDLRVRLVRHVRVPDAETTHRVIDHCDGPNGWTCPAWGHELCDDCERRESGEDG